MGQYQDKYNQTHYTDLSGKEIPYGSQSSYTSATSQNDQGQYLNVYGQTTDAPKPTAAPPPQVQQPTVVPPQAPAAAPTPAPSPSMSMPDLGSVGGEVSAPSMPSMGMSAPAIPDAPTLAATAGLQAAGPGDNTPAAGFKGNAPGGLNPNLGRRNLPNDISALKALTY